MSRQKYIHNRYNSSSKTQTSIQVGLFAKKSFQTKYTWLQRCVDKPKLLTQSCAELTFAFRAKHSRTSCAIISHKKSVIIKPFSNNCLTWHWQSSRNNMQKLIATSGSMPTSHRWRRYLQHTYTGLSKNWHFLKLHNSFGGKLVWQQCLLNQTFSLYHKNDATFRISRSNFWAPQITNSKALLPTLSQNYRNGHCHFGTPCVSVSGGKSAARTKHKREVTKKIARRGLI